MQRSLPFTLSLTQRPATTLSQCLTMQRVGLDSIVSQDPLTYRSVFSVPRSLLEDPAGCTIRSDPSGLGWRFRLSISSRPEVTLDSYARGSLSDEEDSDHDNPQSTSDPVQHTHTIVVFFLLDPWLISLMMDSFSFVHPSCVFHPATWKHLLSYNPFSFSNALPFVEFGYHSAAQIDGIRAANLDGTIELTTSVALGRRTSALPMTKLHARTAQVVEDSIFSGRFIDTKIYLYSTRAANGTVKKPKHFFANSAILARAGSEALDLHFTSHGYQDSHETGIDIHQVPPSEMVSSSYGYDSDSDLEDEEESEEAASTEDDKQVSCSRKTSRNSRVGRVVFLRGTAARTWEAFQRYVYFNEVTFSKLQSTYEDSQAARARFAEKTCSPKSMYRFADQFGIEELKVLALKNLESQLTNANIASEAFSSFSSRYPEILAMQVDRLLENFNDEQVKSQVVSAVGRLARGETHLQPILEKILESLEAKPRSNSTTLQSARRSRR